MLAARVFHTHRPSVRVGWVSLILIVFLFTDVQINQAQVSQGMDDSPFWSEVFAYRDPETVLDGRSAEDVIIMATGDVLLARTINSRMVKSEDFTFPFVNVRGLLSQADIAWVNLETPLVSDCPLRYVGMRFCGDPHGVEGLVYAGIDVANMANNHAENHNEKGVIETEQILTDAEIEVTGLSKPVIMLIHGKRVGLLAFNAASPSRWISEASKEEIETQIADAYDDVDYLVVGFHWGDEYHLSQNSYQRYLAKIAIDAGADLVIGHHPHWLQGVELYKDRPIVYSLGNFVFDQKGGGWVDEGAIALINFQANGELAVNFLPVIIENTSTPRFATQEEAETILRRMASVSGVLEE
jgi:poly-gamma-glutamate capsule biosynthesis protein CapA/YwtB (metallophosphatase superfamily)